MTQCIRSVYLPSRAPQQATARCDMMSATIIPSAKLRTTDRDLVLSSSLSGISCQTIIRTFSAVQLNRSSYIHDDLSLHVEGVRAQRSLDDLLETETCALEHCDWHGARVSTTTVGNVLDWVLVRSHFLHEHLYEEVISRGLRWVEERDEIRGVWSLLFGALWAHDSHCGCVERCLRMGLVMECRRMDLGNGVVLVLFGVTDGEEGDLESFDVGSFMRWVYERTEKRERCMASGGDGVVTGVIQWPVSIHNDSSHGLTTPVSVKLQHKTPHQRHRPSRDDSHNVLTAPPPPRPHPPELIHFGNPTLLHGLITIARCIMGLVHLYVSVRVEVEVLDTMSSLKAVSIIEFIVGRVDTIIRSQSLVILLDVEVEKKICIAIKGLTQSRMESHWGFIRMYLKYEVCGEFYHVGRRAYYTSGGYTLDIYKEYLIGRDRGSTLEERQRFAETLRALLDRNVIFLTFCTLYCGGNGTGEAREGLLRGARSDNGEQTFTGSYQTVGQFISSIRRVQYYILEGVERDSVGEMNFIYYCDAVCRRCGTQIVISSSSDGFESMGRGDDVMRCLHVGLSREGGQGAEDLYEGDSLHFFTHGRHLSLSILFYEGYDLYLRLSEFGMMRVVDGICVLQRGWESLWGLGGTEGRGDHLLWFYEYRHTLDRDSVLEVRWQYADHRMSESLRWGEREGGRERCGRGVRFGYLIGRGGELHSLHLVIKDTFSTSMGSSSGVVCVYAHERLSGPLNTYTSLKTLPVSLMYLRLTKSVPLVENADYRCNLKKLGHLIFPGANAG
ncbi:hypothetical protein Tco_0257100 [Tanacetum coccineum]